MKTQTAQAHEAGNYDYIVKDAKRCVIQRVLVNETDGTTTIEYQRPFGPSMISTYGSKTLLAFA